MKEKWLVLQTKVVLGHTLISIELIKDILYNIYTYAVDSNCLDSL